MNSQNNQWIRKVGLILFSGEKGIDLSELHIKFNIINADVESPNNAMIRVYNLSQETILKIRGEFTQVTLNAGYENGNYGIVFTGYIKQFRIGKEDAVTSYLDILAADGDIGYNQGIINETIAAGGTKLDGLKAAAKAMNMDIDFNSISVDSLNIPSIRGKVEFGMGRASMRNIVSSLDATWSIQNGKVVIIPKSGYLDGEIVELNARSGLIGVPEQTGEGIKITCLLNSKLRIGGRVKLNNSSINQIVEADPSSQAPVAFNQWTLYNNAPLSKDGTYRMFVVEHEGDTRGQAWYSYITGLSIDETAKKDKAVQAL